MVTRREQLGTEDHQLPPGQSKQERGRGRGRGNGRGGGRGGGRGTAKKNAKDDQDETGEKEAKDNDKDAEIQDKGTETKPADEENASPPKPKKRRTKKVQQPQETEPKKGNQPKAADKPSCKRPAASKSKIEAPQPKKAKSKNSAKEEKEVKDQKTSTVDKAEEEISKATEKSSASRTWGGRWIPTDAHALRRLGAIKEVYDNCVSEKVRSPSTLQSPWCTLCIKAFRTKNMELETTTHAEYVAAAALEVEAFFKLEVVRILAYWCIVWAPVE